MKKMLQHTVLLCLLFGSLESLAQNKVLLELDSLAHLLQAIPADTAHRADFIRLTQLAGNRKHPEYFGLSQKGIRIAQKSGYGYMEGEICGHLANYYSNAGEKDSAAHYFEKGIAALGKTDRKKAQAVLYSNYGTHLQRISELHKAKQCFEQSWQLAEATNDTTDQVWALGKLALVEFYNSDFESATAHFIKGIELAELSNNRKMLLNLKSNFAMVKAETGEDNQALAIYQEMLALRKDEIKSNSKAILLNNMGEMLNKLGRVEEAREKFTASAAMFRAMENERYLAYPLGNLAGLEKEAGNYETAIAIYKQSLVIKQKFDDKLGMADVYKNLGDIEISRGNTRQGLAWLNRAKEMAQTSGSLTRQSDVLLSLSEAWHLIGNDKNAYKHYQEYLSLRDSVMNEEKIKTINELQQQYDATRKAREIEKLQHDETLRKMEEREREARLKKSDADALRAEGRAAMTGWIAGIVLLIAVILIFGLRSKIKDHKQLALQQDKIVAQNKVLEQTNANINTQKAEVEKRNAEMETLNKALDKQKAALAHRNKEITDSIVYARRLQDGILPGDDQIRSILPESFVIYLPKDIVSGDFYWFEEKDDDLLFAVVDCTGHGVPGAMVSMIGHNGLHRALSEYHISDPAQLLGKLDELVETSLYQHREFAINDGMDLALGKLNVQTKQFSWAGANNSILLVREGQESGDLHHHKAIRSREKSATHLLFELLPAKRAIGQHDNETVFETHHIQLQKGDAIYLLSDGYADQFGGSKGKKFKSLNFRLLLLEYANLPMAEQRQKLETHFIQWKGDLEQVDDICVMGITIT